MKTVLLFLTVVVLRFECYPQILGVTSDSDSNQFPKFSLNQLQEDLKVLKGSLEDFHPGLYLYHTKNEIDSCFNQLDKSLIDSLNLIELYRKIVPFVSFIGCGHTYSSLPDSINKALRKRSQFIPIDVSVIDNKIYFIENNSLKETSIQPGNEILSINGLSADEIIAKGIKSMSQDGNGISGKIYGLSHNFTWFYSRFIEQPQFFKIEYLDSLYHPKKTRIKALSREEINQNRKDKSVKKTIVPRNLILEYKKDSTVAILQVRQFFGWKENGKKISWKKGLQQIFDELDKSKPSNLIIDVRNNGGGREPWRLTAYLHDVPLTYAKQASFTYSNNSSYSEFGKLPRNINWIKKRGINLILPGSNKVKKLNDSTSILTGLYVTKPFKPLMPQFKGNVFVLINGGSFSATSWFASIAKSNELVTTIGQETSGGYYGQTSMAPIIITLPNTKLIVSIPLVRFDHNVDTKHNPIGRGVIPDYEVKPSIDDVLNGIDTELNFTLDLIKNLGK